MVYASLRAGVEWEKGGRKEGVFVRQPLVDCDNCAQSLYSDCKSQTYKYTCDFLCCSLTEISISLLTFLNEKIAME